MATKLSYFVAALLYAGFVPFFRNKIPRTFPSLGKFFCFPGPITPLDVFLICWIFPSGCSSMSSRKLHHLSLQIFRAQLYMRMTTISTDLVCSFLLSFIFGTVHYRSLPPLYKCNQSILSQTYADSSSRRFKDRSHVFVVII